MEIIYVPLDDTEEEYIKMRARMPWLALPYDKETVNGEACLSTRLRVRRALLSSKV